MGINVFEKNIYVQIYEYFSYKFCSGNFNTPFWYQCFRKKNKKVEKKSWKDIESMEKVKNLDYVAVDFLKTFLKIKKW